MRTFYMKNKHSLDYVCTKTIRTTPHIASLRASSIAVRSLLFDRFLDRSISSFAHTKWSDEHTEIVMWYFSYRCSNLLVLCSQPCTMDGHASRSEQSLQPRGSSKIGGTWP
jgi:hypothetical protein